MKDGSGHNFSVEVVTQQKWNEIGNRSSLTSSNLPDTLFYDPQMPLGFLNLWPQPNAGGYTLFFDSYLQLADASVLTSQITLPPGYELAIQDNLAVALWPFCFTGKPLPPAVEKAARLSLATVKRANKRNNVAQFDKELNPRGQSVYNPYTDSYRST